MIERRGGRGLRGPGVTAWLRLMRIVQHMDRALEGHLRAHGLNIAQFDVLAKVGAAEGINQQELADKLLVTKGNICQMLGRMEQRGLIARRAEGRSNSLSLTPTGRALFEHVVPEHEQRVSCLLSSLDCGEQAQLLHLLRKMEHGLR